MDNYAFFQYILHKRYSSTVYMVIREEECMVRYMRLAMIFPALLLAAGCARLPKAEIEAATSALEEAAAVEADTYAAGEFALAKSALAELNVEVAVQNEKPVASRSYDTAISLAAEAKSAAEGAKAVAAENRAELDSQLAEGLEALERELVSAVETLTKALSIKRINIDREDFEIEMNAVNRLAEQARNDISAGMLFDAREKIVEALERLAASEMKIGAAAMERKR